MARDFAPILLDLGLLAADLVDQAQSEPTKSLLREQTEQARARGIFGAPTFFVDAEMFWGNDRLAIEIFGIIVLVLGIAVGFAI